MLHIYLNVREINFLLIRLLSFLKKNKLFFLFLEINKNNYKKIFNPELFNKYKTYIQRVSDAFFRVERGSVGDGSQFSDSQWETDRFRERRPLETSESHLRDDEDPF